MDIPNLFIVGAQKAGTTSLHNWLMQHEDVFSNDVLKDIDIFGKLFEEGTWKHHLKDRSAGIGYEKYFLQTHVNYIMYEKSLMNIKLNSIDPKIIFIKRNPIDRAISAYLYFKRRNREKRTLKEALIYKPKSIEHINSISYDNNDFTYIEHGFYDEQLRRIYSIFNKDQVLILDFEDIKYNTKKTLNNIFEWLEIYNANNIDLVSKNVGGHVKSDLVNKFIFNSNKTKEYFMSFVKLFFSQKTIDKIKEEVYQLNVSKKPNRNNNSTIEELEEVKNYLIEVYKENETV